MIIKDCPKQELFEKIVGFKDTEALRLFLEKVLTPKEIENMSMRLQIFQLLEQGMTQRAIAEKLKIGIATVSRGAREQKRESSNNV